LKPKFDTNTAFLQQYRRYATEQSSSGSSNTILYGGIATLLAGGGYYYYNQGTVNNAAKEAESKVKQAVGQGVAPAAKAFTGGDQGFISLKLDSVENINHNTKKFRFNLPEGDQVSGLTVASALLTKYKGPEMEKPAIRPYTPVNDEGMGQVVRNSRCLLTPCRPEGIP
jgi:cytochrome-b5 reductase